jgi:SAM-dependent methyltransferase
VVTEKNSAADGDPRAGGDDRVFDTGVAHMARVYNYWLGGKDNYAADRRAAERVLEAKPDMVHGVRSNRAFLVRVVRFLAQEAGIRQFLDIGTGIPSASNTHEVAQAITPQARVVYVDNDPIVLAHAHALLVSDPQGSTSYIEADLRDPEKILAAARELLDFSQPVAVMLIAILHLIEDSDDPAALVATLMDAVPPGSYLAISHPAADLDDRGAVVAKRLNEMVAENVTFRDHAAVTRLFDGLELADPGVVRVSAWRPDSELTAKAPGSVWAGVARKP